MLTNLFLFFLLLISSLRPLLLTSYGLSSSSDTFDNFDNWLINLLYLNFKVSLFMDVEVLGMLSRGLRIRCFGDVHNYLLVYLTFVFSFFFMASRILIGSLVFLIFQDFVLFYEAFSLDLVPILLLLELLINSHSFVFG